MFPPRGHATEHAVLAVDGLLAPGIEAPLSFVARRGEIVGLTGQLGSGASAVVQAIAGHAADGGGADPGRRRGDHRARAMASSSVRRRLLLGRSQARRHLRDAVDPGEHLVPVAALGRRPRRLDLRAATNWRRPGRSLERFAIDTRRLDSPVATLSGGNQQKVAVGKWLGTEPRCCSSRSRRAGSTSVRGPRSTRRCASSARDGIASCVVVARTRRRCSASATRSPRSTAAG